MHGFQLKMHSASRNLTWASCHKMDSNACFLWLPPPDKFSVVEKHFLFFVSRWNRWDTATGGPGRKAVALLRAKRGQPLAVDAIREELSVMELAADTVEGLVAEMRALCLRARHPDAVGWVSSISVAPETSLFDTRSE